jgi:hypothetical protein
MKMPNKERFGVWSGCLMLLGFMVLLLYLEAQAAHPPVVHEIVQLGIVVLYYYLTYRWVQTHLHVFLNSYRQDTEQQEKRPERGTGQSQSDRNRDRQQFEC